MHVWVVFVSVQWLEQLPKPTVESRMQGRFCGIVPGSALGMWASSEISLFWRTVINIHTVVLLAIAVWFGFCRRVIRTIIAGPVGRTFNSFMRWFRFLMSRSHVAWMP